jgi:hypothetical protein
MRGRWILRGLKIIAFALVVGTLLSYATMRLWNWLTPALFGWHLITFWQALGVLVLSKILFGGFRGGPGRHMYWRRKMAERWDAMTPEERDKFRQGMRGRCGPFGPATPATESAPKV